MDDDDRISLEGYLKVHPDLLRPACQHGLFDGEVCPLCAALDRVKNSGQGDDL